MAVFEKCTYKRCEYSMFPDDVTTFIDEMGIDIPDLIICDYIL